VEHARCTPYSPPFRPPIPHPWAQTWRVFTVTACRRGCRSSSCLGPPSRQTQAATPFHSPIVAVAGDDALRFGPFVPQEPGLAFSERGVLRFLPAPRRLGVLRLLSEHGLAVATRALPLGYVMVNHNFIHTGVLCQLGD
jgi:hypothetical protein